jgi:hypothetical protein
MQQIKLQHQLKYPDLRLHIVVLQVHLGPNPLAPINDATTTMAKLNITVWLTPAKIEGVAKGKSTFLSKYHLLAP